MSRSRAAARVPREELAEVFWPGVEKHLVAQSLRTACSNIRKAIGQVVGFDRVGEYFRANGELSIDLDNVIVDVKDFLAHATDGDQQFERGDLRAALRHYQAAEELYTGSLLIGEMREPWVDAAAAETRTPAAISSWNVSRRWTPRAIAGAPVRRARSSPPGL